MDGTEPSSERDVVDFVTQITDSARMRIEENLPHGFVRLKVAEAERRQAQHDIRSVEDVVTELVRNSRDAGARVVLVAFQKEQGRYRKITVIDDGCGIPDDMHGLVFEPRVTSKSEDFEEDRYGVHGRGMALFSIRSRSVKAEIVSSEPGRGTTISVVVDTKKVPERSDQASMPELVETDSGWEVGSGPHNVARVLVEMSVDHPEMDFYLGSFANALATARKLAIAESDEGPWGVIGAIDDARELADVAREVLGLPVSERNAYRVLNDEIAPLETTFGSARFAAERAPAVPRRAGGGQAGRRALVRPVRRIAREDMAEIGRECSEVVERVTRRYYLQVTGEPRVRRGRGKIIVSFFISGEEGEEE